MRANVVVLMLLLAICSSQAATVEVDGVYYDLKKTKHTASVASCVSKDHPDNYKGCISVPAMIKVDGDEYTVVGISKKAFAEAYELKEITLPNTLKELDKECFLNCTSLERMFYFADEPAVAAANAFSNCSLKLTVIVNKGAQSNFASAAVWNAQKIAERGSYYVEGNHLIGGVMYDLKGDQATVEAKTGGYSGSVIIPSSVELYTTLYHVSSIGNNAFANCSDLKVVSITESVRSMGQRAFSGSAIKEFVVPRGGLTAISESAFANCKSLESVKLDASVRTIGKSAFSGCKKLQKVELAEGLEQIQSLAFESCETMKEFRLPNSVTSVDENAFNGCSGLIKPVANDKLLVYCHRTASGDFTVKEGTVRILGNAFRGSKIRSVTLPSSVTQIGGNAFADCSNLRMIHVLADQPARLESNSFSGLPSNYAVIVNEGAKSAYISDANWGKMTIAERGHYYPVEAVEIDGIRYALTGSENATVVAKPGDDSYSGEIAIPDSIQLYTTTFYVRAIGSGAFAGCNVTSVILPDSLLSIGDGAFYRTGLTEIELPSSLTEIAEFAFSESGLASVVIPDGVSVIRSYAFNGCPNLSSVKLGKGLKKIGTLAFGNTDIRSITLPNGLTEIGDFAFMSSSLESIVLPNSLKKVGCGILNYTNINKVVSTNSIFVYLPSSVEGSYSVPSGITTIAGHAFDGSYYLTSITLPPTVKTIGEEAFRNCNSLERPVCSTTAMGFVPTSLYGTCEFPENISYVAGGALSGCSNIHYFTLSDKVKYVGPHAFRGVDNLYDTYTIKNSKIFAYISSDYKGDLHINEGIEEIAGGAFYSSRVSSVSFPTTLKTVRKEAFQDAEIPTLDFRNTQLRTIEEKAFSEAKASSVLLPEGVTVIPNHAFSNSSIESMTLPSTVTEIGVGAFSETEFERITIPAGVKHIGTIAFGDCALEYITFESVVPPTLGVEVFDMNSLKKIVVPKSAVALYKALWPEYCNMITGEGQSTPAPTAYTARAESGASSNPAAAGSGYVEENGDDDEVFIVVEKMPEFPGGQAALFKYLSENVKYPAIAQENGIQGRVICQFVVNTDGSIVDVEVVRSGGDASLDNEAIRVVRAMPNWNPGRHRGKNVRVKYTVPVNFKLQ